MLFAAARLLRLDRISNAAYYLRTARHNFVFKFGGLFMLVKITKTTTNQMHHLEDNAIPTGHGERATTLRQLKL